MEGAHHGGGRRRIARSADEPRGDGALGGAPLSSVVVVLPAYNAVRTLARTLSEIDRSVVDRVLLVDDGSVDGTAALARQLGLDVVEHPVNRGYGANQKTCYREALAFGADVVVMVHPDYQYTPRLIPAMVDLLRRDAFDVVLGSRILGGGALAGGMPRYKYVANRALTAIENLATGAKLSEYHTGYRAFTRRVLETLPLGENGDDFVFDAEMLAQCLHFGFRVGEVSCPTRYAADSSSISASRAVVYGLGVLRVTAMMAAVRLGTPPPPWLSAEGRRLG